jgi:hypothetical protein
MLMKISASSIISISLIYVSHLCTLFVKPLAEISGICISLLFFLPPTLGGDHLNAIVVTIS